MKKSFSTLVILWSLFLFIGLVFVTIGVFLCINTFDYSDKIEIPAVITRMDSKRDSNNRISYDVYVSYEVDGKEYNNKLNGYSSSYYEGKDIKIYYQKDEPHKIGVKYLDYLVLIFPGIGMIFVLIGGIGLFVLIRKKKAKNKLKDNGRLIYAKFVEIKTGNVRINNVHSKHIICSWVNPEDGKTYLFKSEGLYGIPFDMLNLDNIPVYIDKNNIKKYYVDINTLTKDIIDLS